MERLLNALWQHEIERINDHLPKATRSLEELLGTEKPELPTRGGGRHYFEREDLEFLGKEIPRELHSRVMLPIILTRRLDLGKGVFSVSGGRIEKSIVRWLLETGGRERFQLYEDEDGPHFVYRPQVGILISGRRTLFAVGFV
ncbi:MAG: DUF61 family protein [Candidatus Bathyarchaeia archaeon]